MSLFLVEGQTAPVDYKLLADGAAYDLTGCTVAITARTRVGAVKTLAGTMAVLVEASGTVRFSPDAADFVAADFTLQVRFKVTRADGKIEFFPTGQPEFWVIQK